MLIARLIELGYYTNPFALLLYQMRDIVGPGKCLVVLRVSILGLVKGFDLTQGTGGPGKRSGGTGQGSGETEDRSRLMACNHP